MKYPTSLFLYEFTNLTADTQTGRITANLRFIDEFTRMEGDAPGNLHTRKERLQRFLSVEIQLDATDRGTTSIQMDFAPTVKGVNYAACDSIIQSLSNTFDTAPPNVKRPTAI